MKRAPAITTGLAILWGGCTGNAPEVSFQHDIAPLFARSCNDCHGPGSPTGYNLVDPFHPDEGIVERDNSWVPNGSAWPLLVDPGDAEASFLVAKLRGEGLQPKVDGAPMPLHLPPLDDAELDAVATWIADGAEDDAHFREEVAPLFGTELTLRRTSGRCTWCHHPGTSNPMDVLDVFNPQTGLVGAQSAWGGLIVSPGEPEASVLMSKLRGEGPGYPMPLHPPAFSDEEVQRVVDWIDQGALDN